jgi:trans-2,3-dihydro-3-hydroxyanthranilate isomerase
MPVGSDAVVIHTRVFAAKPGGGNPCPVIAEASGLTSEQMQSLARRFGQDTAFILPPKTTGADIRIRYFVPDHEMGVSGHATIAAVTVALSRPPVRSKQMTVETLTGLFDVTWISNRRGYLVTVGQNAPDFGTAASSDVVADVLRIHPSAIDVSQGPVQSVSVSRPKLIIPLRNWEILDRVTPDYASLSALCDRTAVSGLYPFTRRTNKPNAQYEARQFPIRGGIPEDPATGVAAAALGAYLTRYDLAFQAGHHAFMIAQGYTMGAPSLIASIADCSGGRITKTAICGSADIVSQERIHVDP